MQHFEFLVSYGPTGEFARFRSDRPASYRRGERVVIRTHRGIEIGTVLRVATEDHAPFLPNTTLGRLLRGVTAEDEADLAGRHEAADRLLQAACRLAEELDTPIHFLDAEVLLDGEQAFLHYLPFGVFDERELVSRLSRQFELRVALHRLANREAETEPEDEAGGCGRPGCGSTSSGGCGSSGGCSTCGVHKARSDREHFARLRKQMEAAPRHPLL